ncbi:MAG TPA: YceI family protein [Polyangia bacterium]|jgi:polyisoprenoid-binding protein YceI|nr:YceI family protein [Polyangia bacterium]
MSATNVSNPSSASKPVAPGGEAIWDIDTAHSAAHFKVRHLMVSYVRGTLGPVSGTVTLDEKDLTRSRVDVRIDARAIETRDAKRDEHLRSADFLDVANHPTVTFVSRQVRKENDGSLQVAGDLTIRSTTKPVTLTVEALEAPVADPWGNTKRGVNARTTINRKDWGLEWNVGLEAGGVLVGEQVAIEIEVELARRKA